MKFIVYLSLMLSAVLCKAEDFDYALVGGNYTCIDFYVDRKNNWPIFFEAMTKNDSIKVDLSNFDKFVESVFQSCSYVGNSTSTYWNIFYDLFGRSGQTDDICSLTVSEYGNKFKKFDRKTTLYLQTGEKVDVNYCDVWGIFARFGKTYVPYSGTSNGLPKEYLVMDEVYFPITGLDFRKGTLYFIKKENDEEKDDAVNLKFSGKYGLGLK